MIWNFFSIGMTKEQARSLEMNNDQFVCPPCRSTSGKGEREFSILFVVYLEGTSNSPIKPARSSDESIVIKRKRIDAVDRRENISSSKNLTHSEPSKRPKTGIFFQRDSSTVNIHKISFHEIHVFISSSRNHKFIALSMVVPIGRNPVGFTVRLLVFVVISMILFK